MNKLQLYLPLCVSIRNYESCLSLSWLTLVKPIIAWLLKTHKIPHRMFTAARHHLCPEPPHSTHTQTPYFKRLTLILSPHPSLSLFRFPRPIFRMRISPPFISLFNLFTLIIITEKHKLWSYHNILLLLPLLFITSGPENFVVVITVIVTQQKIKARRQVPTVTNYECLTEYDIRKYLSEQSPSKHGIKPLTSKSAYPSTVTTKTVPQ